jgi:hypothetical protein
MELISIYSLMILLGLSVIFHLCVLFKIIPYKIVWGGRLNNDQQMYRFEVVSLSVNFVFLFIVAWRGGFIQLELPKLVLVICLWSMAALFLLNTFGNLMAKNKLERNIFTPLTLISSVLCGYLAYTM